MIIIYIIFLIIGHVMEMQEMIVFILKTKHLTVKTRPNYELHLDKTIKSMGIDNTISGNTSKSSKYIY